jgi:hypothetical protein
MPTMARLCDIATIFSGLNAGAARGNPCKFVQMRDLVWSDRPLVEGERPTAGRARPVDAADVLLAARGERSVAVRPRNDMIGAFVTLDVYLIKPDLRRLDADYLVAFLARPDVGTQLRISTAGASLPRIPKSALADLELPLPDLDRQRAIGGLCRSLGRRVRIYDRLKAAETQLTDCYLNHSFAQLR